MISFKKRMITEFAAFRVTLSQNIMYRDIIFILF